MSLGLAVVGIAPTPSIFAPVSTPAFAIRELSFLVLAIVTVIFVVVAGLTVYAIIVIVLFLTTARYIFAIERHPAPPDALEITVVGNQWWWEIRYPGLGIVTANELHVPVSDAARPTPTFITLESADVIHSFWIPQLAGKMDVIPGQRNRTWVEPRTPGTYVGQCAEFCGVQHAGMLLTVTVHSQDDFARWVAAQQAVAADVPAVRAGRDMFTSVACISCHTVRGTPANGRGQPPAALGPEASRRSRRAARMSCDGWTHKHRRSVVTSGVRMASERRWISMNRRRKKDQR